ncbi:hypothetical protein [Streptomyces sp. NPDC087437]|uniref:hypothetical protein n=1 Tax=Streptomyces sp. NPDC087437 TaxID=3365789 RepID=UPI00381F9D72
MTQDHETPEVSGIERAIGELTAASSRLSEAHARVEFAQQGVDQAGNTVLQQLRQLRDQSNQSEAPTVTAVVRHLYWHQRHLASRAIAEAAGFGEGNRGVHGMLAAIGPRLSGVHCANCGAELLQTSRSWAPGSPPLCPTCKVERDQEQNRLSRLGWLRAKAVGSSLVTAAVWEWRAVTTLILAYPPVSEGIARGSEDDRQLGTWRHWEMAESLHNALTQLGLGDHEAFGVPATVARDLVSTGFKSVGWDAARTRSLLDPITQETAHAILTRVKQRLDDAVAAATKRAERDFLDGSEAEPDDVWPWTGYALYWPRW